MTKKEIIKEYIGREVKINNEIEGVLDGVEDMEVCLRVAKKIIGRMRNKDYALESYDEFPIYTYLGRAWIKLDDIHSFIGNKE